MATTAQADTCPNAELRALNNSSGLADCRAYEMVTSPYKQGFTPNDQTYSDDGAFAYYSVGNFADNPFGALGNQYVARRSQTGWKTISMNPPGDQWIFRTGGEGAQNGLSKDLRSSLWPMRPLSRPDEHYGDHPDRDSLYVRRPDGVFSLIAPNPGTTIARAFASTPDLSHVVWGADEGQAPNLYEVSGGDQVLRPIGVDNTGAPLPEARGELPQGISVDGRVIFFAPCTRPDLCYKPLRARVGGVTTIEMSASQCTRGVGDVGGVCNGDAPVSPAGFAVDGSRALFTTTQQLVNGDRDATNDLYACDIPAGTPAPVVPVNVCPNLRQVSAGAVGGADVEGMTRVADDGSRVYFVAKGVLAANVGANDETAVAGAHNLYVWQADGEHPAGRTTFMARLLVNDVGGDENGETTPDGRYLLVNTTTPLVSSGASADTDSALDVYRYDVITGQWRRLSTDTTGSGANAELDAVARASAFRGYKRRHVSMTDDGQTVVFQTGEALAPTDTNSIVDVYEWHGGQVSLISPDGGRAGRITASGTDIFFSADNQVTAADGDTNPDVYDARVGGGFDLREQAPCAGDACQGESNATPAVITPRSGTAAGGGDGSDVKPTLVLETITAAQRRSLTATGKATLTVTAGVAGTVSAKATATISGKTTSVSSTRRTVATPGTVTLALTLSKQARAQLAARGKLTVRVVVAHSEVAAVRSVTLKLTNTQHKAKTKKAIKRLQAKRTASSVQGGRS